MERGSDKHGPRLDEEMKEETQGMERGAPVSPRVEPHRTIEDVDDEQEATQEPSTEGPERGRPEDQS